MIPKWISPAGEDKGVSGYMNKQDWYDCGEKIGDIVSDAISHNDFGALSESITDVLNESLDAMQKSMQRARRMQEEAMASVTDARRAAAQTPGRTQDATWRYAGSAYPQSSRRSVRRKGLGSITGLLKEVIGGMLTFFNGFLTVAVVFASLTEFDLGGLFISLLFVLITYGSFRLMRSGRDERTISDTARRYVEVLGDREVISVDELAAATGRSKKAVKRYLKRILREGLIGGEVYLDDAEENLMVSRRAYDQYRQTLKAYEARRKADTAQKKMQTEAVDKTSQADRRAEAEKHMDHASEETRGIMKEGNAFIAHIHEANKKIPDEVLSEKLDRLELVVTRIFEQVAAAPDSAPDMHRLMNYYLPTTKKLLDAYVELDSQRVQGQNIVKAKQEIETSLDTINTAFEIMLDNMFQEKAWDIETDIQTLQTMMARDGLIDDGLKQKKPSEKAGQGLTFGAGAGAYAEEEQ